MLAAALLAGCTRPPAPTPAGSAAVDLCADRLHDLCGALLEYGVLHQDLPERLQDLPNVGPGTALPLVCPKTGRAYVYNPVGLAVAGREGRLIIYDAVPAHDGKRQGILLEPPQLGKPVIPCVVRLSEAAILWQRPATQPGRE